MTPDADTAEDLVKCALCGYEYTVEQAEKACRSCPFHRKCGLLRCPNCGYETPVKK